MAGSSLFHRGTFVGGVCFRVSISECLNQLRGGHTMVLHVAGMGI